MTTMAFIKQSRPGRWEIRESRFTANGPRSTTLATFETLDHSHLVLASERAQGEFDEHAIVESARRAGAPVSLSPADQAATALLRAIGDGDSPSPGLRKLLTDALSGKQLRPATEEALGYVGKSAEQRGADLFDLMLLSDAIPAKRVSKTMSFPPIAGANG